LEGFDFSSYVNFYGVSTISFLVDLKNMVG